MADQPSERERKEHSGHGRKLPREVYFRKVLELTAERSTCLRGQVACIAIRENRIIAMGYNGAPAGMDECLDVGCLEEPSVTGCQRSTHDVANMVASAARFGTPLADTRVISTHSPCGACARLLIVSGIATFEYITDYRLGRCDLLESANIPVSKSS